MNAPADMKAPVRISVIVAVTADCDRLDEINSQYAKALQATGQTFEMIYVLDGRWPKATASLRRLVNQGENIAIYRFDRPHGEAAALNVGFHHARGDIVVTLGTSHQIMIDDLAKVLAGLDSADMVVASRVRPGDDGIAVPEGKFDRTLRYLLGSSFRDIRCGVRAMKSAVAKELSIYGNQQRFLPLIAQAQGFSVIEAEVRPVPDWMQAKKSRMLDFNGILDVITIYFLIRFTKKPFRFFGGFGFAVLALGLLSTAYLVIERLFFDVPLADRPSLILSSLLVVLGIQIISVGLIGEIITFSYARDVKDYKVDRMIDRIIE